MSDKIISLSRNPNLCASCSSLADGMGEALTSGIPEATEPEPKAVPPEPETTIRYIF